MQRFSALLIAVLALASTTARAAESPLQFRRLSPVCHPNKELVLICPKATSAEAGKEKEAAAPSDDGYARVGTCGSDDSGQIVCPVITTNEKNTTEEGKTPAQPENQQNQPGAKLEVPATPATPVTPTAPTPATQVVPVTNVAPAIQNVSASTLSTPVAPAPVNTVTVPAAPIEATTTAPVVPAQPASINLNVPAKAQQ